MLIDWIKPLPYIRKKSAIINTESMYDEEMAQERGSTAGYYSNRDRYHCSIPVTHSVVEISLFCRIHSPS